MQPVSEEKAKEIIAKFKEIDFGREPLQMTCPVCMKDITTVTDDASGLLTCICCTSIFILGYVLLLGYIYFTFFSFRHVFPLFSRVIK